MNNKKLLILLGVLVVALGVVIGVFLTQREKDPQEQAKKNDKAPATGVKLDVGKPKKYDAPVHEAKHPVAVITFTDGSVIRIELYPEIAPVTVSNFLKLCGQKFYDGLTIHRVSPGFVIQGGAPGSNPAAGASWTIKGEFASNGFENTLSHRRGTVSMARTSADKNSASSQFFIVLDDKAVKSLDGDYAAFGRVLDAESMAVVDAIAKLEITNPYAETLRVEPVFESIRIEPATE
ncbi:MAG: peptidylprolyl isomerase [Clostridia bacterium]|nr:peptidylprolyl isomerase [Clostridia bacterium]